MRTVMICLVDIFSKEKFKNLDGVEYNVRSN